MQRWRVNTDVLTISFISDKIYIMKEHESGHQSNESISRLGSRRSGAASVFLLACSILPAFGCSNLLDNPDAVEKPETSVSHTSSSTNEAEYAEKADDQAEADFAERLAATRAVFGEQIMDLYNDEVGENSFTYVDDGSITINVLTDHPSEDGTVTHRGALARMPLDINGMPMPGATGTVQFYIKKTPPGGQRVMISQIVLDPMGIQSRGTDLPDQLGVRDVTSENQGLDTLEAYVVVARKMAAELQ